MKIIYNSIIPFSGYKAINLFGVLFARKNKKIDDKTINHESIHTKQIVECGFIFFYIIYALEYIIKKPISWFIDYVGNYNYAYRSISFEQEAYYNEKKKTYLKNRKHYAWVKYIFKMYDTTKK